MWRCLVFVVTVTFWNISVLAVPQGDNTCQGVVKHPVKIKVNVTEPVTFRSYTWCLRVPPRCSQYVVQMRERVKEQVEMHNRTITVCCRGYVEIESKCVPACPPLTDCPNMHCNRTNHCYCTPGYSGTFCNDPCTKGFWGTDCKKPCDCPEGFTCHHLTGDCMLDDKPAAKTTVRRAFTHVSSESVTTERPSTSTPKRTTQSPAPFITTLPTTTVTTTRSILTTTTFKPSQTTEQELSTVSLKYNSSKSTVSPPPYFKTEIETTDSRDKINILKSNIMNKDISTETATFTFTKIPALIDSVPDANPPTRMPVYSKPSIKKTFYEKSITTTTNKSFPSPEYVTVPHYEDNQEIIPSHIADKPLSNDNQEHPSSTILPSPKPDILKKKEERKGSEESKGERFDSNPELTFLNNLPSTPSFQLDIETVDRSEDIVSNFPQPTKSSSHNFKPVAPAVEPSTFPTHLQQSTSPKSQFKHQEFVVSSSTTVQSTTSPLTTSEPILPDRSPEPTTSFGGVDNLGDFTFRPSNFDDSTTRPVYVPMIPMRTPNRNWNPFIPAPVPTQSHDSLTFPFTITGYNINTNKPDTFPEIFTDKPIGQISVEPDKFAPTLLTHPPVVQTSSSYNLKPYFIPPFDHFGVPTKSPGRISSNSMLPSDHFINSNLFKKPSTTAYAQETVVTYLPDDVVTQKEDKAKIKSISVNTTPFSIKPTDKSNLPKDDIASVLENDKNYLLSKFFSVPPANYPSFEISSPSQSHQKTELISLPYVTKPLDILTLPAYLNIPTDKPREITARKLDYQNVSVPFLGAPGEIYRSDKTVKTVGLPSVIRVETREDNAKKTIDNIDESSEEETAVKPTIFESVQILNKNNYISLLKQKTDKTTDTIAVTVPNMEETNDALGTTNIIRLSTYSFLNKTVPSSIPYEMNTTVSKNITNYGFNVGVKTNHSFAHNSELVPSLPITTPLPPFTEEIHTIVNGKLLEEPSNYLPTILDSVTTKELVIRNKSQYSTKQFVTEVPQAGYLPTDKDFLNLTYILNSITDFTSNSKRAMKQSPKSGLYSNSINAKLTENPFFNLVTNSVHDKHPSTEIINPVTAFPSQIHSKHGYKLSSLHNKVASSFNNSKIIVLNVSSHLSFQNPLSQHDGKVFAPEGNQQVSSLLNPSFYSGQKSVTRSIDGRVTTVSIVSTVPFTKSPTKRSAKETTDSRKTEYTFTHNYGPKFVRGRQDLDTSKTDRDATAAYDSIKFTLPDEFDSKLLSTVSNEGSLSMTDEVSKKPFRRKEISVLEEEGAEVRPNMTAALAAQSAEPDSNISLTTGILATVTCAILVASISSVFILIFIYCKKREKPIPMESCIMAYESTESNDPAVIYSVPRPSLLLPDVFFCPTFTNHYAAQINKELRELSYDDSSKKENSEPVYAEITTELQLPGSKLQTCL